MNINKLSLPFLAFLQATGLLIYTSLISLFIFNADSIFGKTPNFYGPVAFLLLFIISAVICALIFLGRAGLLFWEKRYRECFKLVSWTLAWSIVYLTLVFVILFISK